MNNNKRLFGVLKELITRSQTSALCHIILLAVTSGILSFSLVLSITPPSLASPDAWSATYRGVYWHKSCFIRQTNDGGYVVASNTDAIGAGSSDVWVMKLGPDGTIEWQKAYWEMYFDSSSSIQQTTDGGYIVAGHLQSLDDIGGDFWLLKLKSDGDVEWQKTYGGNESSSASSVQQTADGGYIVAGVTWPSGGGDEDIWVLKLRPDGDVEWQKTYGGSGR
ncbi:MAG: hypothetical protein GY800_05815, partial [Planctomycetes bacterium]|nr:hypothetical protein [Planctomycetota bacterium]